LSGPPSSRPSLIAAASLEAARRAGPLIEAVGLRRSYGPVQAVRDVSFSVGRGEVVGFLGPNGAGKSTTLRMIVGYLGPSGGSVRVNGYDVVEQPLEARQAIGYMPESAALYPEMRVTEYLSFRARLKRLPRADIRTQVERALHKARVADVAQALIGTLSRGYRQRVALADALLGDPPLLILDEPTAGLDPNQIHGVRQLIRQLGAEHTVLLSTHILSEVESTCSRAIVIDRGRLVAEGSIAELRRRRGGQRAVLTVHDARQRAGALLMAAEHVVSVTPLDPTSSILPPRPGEAEVLRRTSAGGAPFEEAAAQGIYSEEGIVSILVTFAPEADGFECVERLIAILVRADIRVREARLRETSLEEVFRQLTGAEDVP
jgi:ABC-2 type transport system ATP-binding protein